MKYLGNASNGNAAIVVCEDFYHESELNLIWEELNFIAKPSNLLPPEKTSAAVINGVIQKKNSGVFLDDVYADRKFSNILNLNRSIFGEDLVKELIKFNPIFRHLANTNKDNTLVSYYENGDYYKPHTDACNITVLNYYFKEPKAFTGGNFRFNDFNIEIEVKNNMTIFMPSCYLHEVTPIEYLSDKPGYGRYCVSQFTYVV